MNKPIIAFVGELASGKSVAAALFRDKYGFEVISLSSFIKQRCQELGVTQPTREQLQNIGNWLRETQGGGVLVKLAIELAALSDAPGFIIDAPRNLEEVGELKCLGGQVIAIEADTEVRANRLLNVRRRVGDPITREEFDHLDRRDKGEGEGKHGQQVAACMEQADYRIDNNSDDIKDLERACEILYGQLGVEGGRRQVER